MGIYHKPKKREIISGGREEDTHDVYGADKEDGRKNIFMRYKLWYAVGKFN